MEQRSNKFLSWAQPKELFPRHLVWLFVLIIAVFTGLMLITNNFYRSDLPKIDIETESGVTHCMDRYGTKRELQNTDLLLVQSIYNSCAYIVTANLVEREQGIRSDNYVFQRSENIVLMYMVVIITISGVVLAALQLFASYKLAELGKGSLAVGGEVDINRNQIAVKSSVMGVVILGISFAFFLVFVIFVYTIRDDKVPSDAGRSPPSQAIQQSSGNEQESRLNPNSASSAQPNIGRAVPRKPKPAIEE